MAEQTGKPVVLVVDDSRTNLKLLHEIFSKEYQVEQAENGLQAMAILRRVADVAAVILDIKMPELDGYGVLRAMRADEQLRDIPVVVDTGSDDLESQLKALDLGALDVLIKPFNPQIALHRVRNLINHREAGQQAARNRVLEEQLRQSEIDERTGILNKKAFCRKTAELLAAHPNKSYVILRWDIDRFKIFNDTFGVPAGDILLSEIGQILCNNAKPGTTCGHWEADHFVLCVEAAQFQAYEFITELNRTIGALNSLYDDFDFVTRVGVYQVNDPTVDVSLMCDRALLALRSVKNNYLARVAFYDDSMRASLLEEQEILQEMERALAQGQFVVYLQPQYDYAAGTLDGAEALVRWQHPKKGLISPGKFIPVFERNGFISNVDEYVWEQVCRMLRGWLDDEKPIVPISVNISRRDIYRSHLCGLLQNLVKKYRLAPELLRLEITESAYMDNPDQLIEIVNELLAAGFTVEMDDFGSGYSSLNTLKDVPVQTLKLDMKFLEKSMNDTRGGNILTSVIRMAHWLKLPVIAEGVETKAQADYLKSIGCTHMQGYYFAKPMPVKEFEKILASSTLKGGNQKYFSDDIEGAENFLSASTQATLLFNSFVGGAAIIEYDGSNVEALRLNDKYFETLGVTREEYAGKQLHLLDRFDKENRAILVNAIEKAIETGRESSCELHSLPIGGHNHTLWTRVQLRLLAQNANRYILYLAVEDITQRVKLLTQNSELTEHLSAIMDNLPGGILDYEITDKARISYFNDMAPAMFGYTREEYQKLFADDPLATIHPDDFPKAGREIGRLICGEVPTLETVYRHICRNGTWRYVRLTARVLRKNGDVRFASGILLDIDDEVKSRQTAAKQEQELEKQRISLQALYDTIPCGIMQFSAASKEGETGKLLSLNDTAWKISGYDSRSQYVAAMRGKSKLKDVYPEDLPIVSEALKKISAAKTGMQTDCEFRIIRPDGSIRWLRVLLQRVNYQNGEEAIQVVLSDISHRKQADLKRLSGALFGLFDEVFEFDLDQNICSMRSAKNPDDSRIGKLMPFNRTLDILCERYAFLEDRQRIRDFYQRTGNRANAMPETLEYRYHDAEGKEHWASNTVLYLSGSVHLSCNKDITGQKNAEFLAKENEKLQALAAAQQKESERNRLFIEKTGVLVYDYDPVSDVLKTQRMDSERGVVEETTQHYFATLSDNPFVSVEDRERIREMFAEAIKEPLRRTLEYRSNRFGGGFCDCSVQIASIANEAGKVCRIVGQVSQVQNDMNQSLNKKLFEFTGCDFKDLAYDRRAVREVLQTLNAAADSRTAVQAILSYLGEKFDVSRTYIMQKEEDGRYLLNTFEWCGGDAAPEKNHLPSRAYREAPERKYAELFGDNEIFSCSDVSTLPDWIRKELEPRGVRAIIQCAILKGGAFCGCLGFDECRRTRIWTGQQINALRIVAQILSTLLFSNHENDNFDLPEETLRRMDSSPAYIYMVDPDTYEVLYWNPSVEASKGVPLRGEPCYKAFARRDAVCPGCPIRSLSWMGLSLPVEAENDGRRYIMQASSFLWHGRKVIQVLGTDRSCFAENVPQIRQTEYNWTLQLYTRTLSALYDEIVEFNFAANTFLPLYANYKQTGRGVRATNLYQTFTKWIETYVCAKDRAALDEFMDLAHIREMFRKGRTPSMNYQISLPDGSLHYCQSTLLQMDVSRYLCCTKDVTSQKNAELDREKLQILKSQAENQNLYRVIVAQTGIAAFEMNLQTGKFSSTKAYHKYEMSRCDQQEIIYNRGDRSIVHPDDQQLLDRFFNATKTQTPYLEETLRVKMTDGSYRWTKMAGTFLKDKNGKVLRIIGSLTDLDAQMRSKIALERLSTRMQQIISNIPTGVAIYEMEKGKLLPVYASDKTCEMFGFTRKEYDLRIANGQSTNFVPTADELTKAGLETLMSGKPLVIRRMHAKRKDGSRFWLRAFCSMSRNEEGVPLYYAVLVNITEELAREQEYLWQMEKYRILSESTDVITFDYAPQDDVMRISLHLPGEDPIETTYEHYAEEVSHGDQISNEEERRFISTLRSAASGRASGTYDFRGNYYGTLRWYRAKYVTLADEEGCAYRVIGRLDDINDMMLEKDRLRMDAQYDELTGILNKNYGLTAIKQALKKRTLEEVNCILFMDIDNFKWINDSYGHLEADQVLRQVGMILRELFSGADIVVRFGGDEFIVYMKSAASLEAAEKKAARILEELHRITIGTEKPIRASIGIISIAGESADYESVFKCVDEALYKAKKEGKDRYTALKYRPKKNGK